MTPNNIHGAQLISKACGLLKLFSRQQSEMSLTELAAQSGLHPTTAYRIAQALVLEGLLIQDSEKNKYRLGYGLIKLGDLARHNNDLTRVAAPHAEELARLWGETTLVDTMNRNFDLISVLAVPSTYRVSINPNYDQPIPAHCVAAGKVMLAELPSDRLAEFLARELIHFTSKTITDPARLLEELDAVRQRGYATNLEEHEYGFNAFAAPIRDAGGKVIAAVSVGGPASRLTEEKLPSVASSVVDTARFISSDLGYEHGLE
jgi:DNA-binding IclR family transcriptional regulator